ncbi:MAG: hypothetical protein RR382_10915 [Tannerellaceae bacterium]
MKKYFSEQLVRLGARMVSESQLIEYRNLVVVAMEKNGATQDEVTLVHDETIINSIQKKRQPEDVAWAILQ